MVLVSQIVVIRLCSRHARFTLFAFFLTFLKGTDATIAQHITTICDRRYAERDANQRFHPTKLGIALVEGYNSMGYRLNLPDLRREMEANCSAIAAGHKSKEDVLVPILAKMLDVFIKANEEVHKLDAAVERHFSKLGSNNSQYILLQANFSLCGTCNGKMTLKQQIDSGGRGSNRQRNDGSGGGSKLLHCTTCSRAHLMPRYHQHLFPAVKQGSQHEPLTCPICEFQLIKCENDGNSYHVCPHCFSDPPVNYGGDSSTDFPCSKCTHNTCTLATGIHGGNVEVFACPFCSAAGNVGSVSLKRSSNGFRLSCSNGGRDRCQFVIWLPKAAKEVVLDGTTDGNSSVCAGCSTQERSVRKLKFVWKMGSVPPHYDRELTTCVLCDDHFTRDMDIRIPSINQVQPRRTGATGGGRGRGSGRGSNGDSDFRRGSDNGRGAGGGIQCFQCGGPHFANACPNYQR